MGDEAVATANVPRVLLLRHGAVASHQGDSPLTRAGRQQSDRGGRKLAAAGLGRIKVLTSATQRARQTASLLVHGVTSADPSAHVSGPSESFALRNPDLYLAGERVDMVSSARAFTEQVGGLTEGDVLGVPFFARFLAAPDRIGWWLHHDHPPGDDAADVARRILAFGASLRALTWPKPDTVIGITHSPVLRAVGLRLLGEDPGEPEYLEGYSLWLGSDGSKGGETRARVETFTLGVE